MTVGHKHTGIIESNSCIEIFDSCCHSFAVGSLVAEWYGGLMSRNPKEMFCCPGSSCSNAG